MIFIAKKGTLEDAKWHPSGENFVVISEYPKRATLYSGKNLTKIFDFGQAPRNSIFFSPNGKKTKKHMTKSSKPVFVVMNFVFLFCF